MAESNSTVAPDGVVAKVCPECGICKGLNDFYASSRSKDGAQRVCKACMAEYKRKRGEARSPHWHEAKNNLAAGQKRCLECESLLPATEFHRKGLSLMPRCKMCTSRINKEAREKSNPELADRKMLALRGEKRCASCCKAFPATAECFYTDRGRLTPKCKDCARSTSEAYRKQNPEAVKLTQRLWAEKKRDYLRQRNSEWSKKNIAQKKAYMSSYYAANKDRFIQGNLRRTRIRRTTDPVFCLTSRIRSAIGDALRKGGYGKRSKSQEILGCDWYFFAKHIERQFLKGMSWENRSEWHIDHIIPLSTAKTEEDVIRLSHYTNLRPLWAEDNLKKSDKQEFLI